MGESDRYFENKKERMMSVCLIGGNPNKTFKYAKLDISIQIYNRFENIAFSNPNLKLRSFNF